jgi:hypothetical protein
MRFGRGSASPLQPGRRRTGFVLLTILIVVMLSSMVAVSLLYATKAETTAQAAGVRGEQAWAAAMSGVRRALVLAETSMPGEAAWQDNAASLRHQEVVDDGSDRWYFSVWTRSDSEAAPLRFGFSDEASRLNVTVVPEEWLSALPGFETNLVEDLPADLPASPEDSPAEFLPEEGPAEGEGGEDTDRPPRMQVPAGTVAAFLAGQGLGVGAMFGEDANRNLYLDANEDDGEARMPVDNQDGRLDPGLQAYLTSLSYEPNVDPDGVPRVNLNDAEASLDGLGLSRTTVDYLEALRRGGQTLNHVADLLEAEANLPNEQGAEVAMESGVGREELTMLLERCTTTDATNLVGLVNVNTASVAVLRCLPGVDESLAESIVATRGALNEAELRTPAWLFTQGLLNAEAFRALAPHITTRSFQFRFPCVGYGVPSGRYRVLEAVIDVAARPARIVSVRDLTALGFPLPLNILEPATGIGGSVQVAPPKTEPGSPDSSFARMGSRRNQDRNEHPGLAGRPSLTQTYANAASARSRVEARPAGWLRFW